MNGWTFSQNPSKREKGYFSVLLNKSYHASFNPCEKFEFHYLGTTCEKFKFHYLGTTGEKSKFHYLGTTAAATKAALPSATSLSGVGY